MPNQVSVLLIEDEPKVAANVKQWLEEHQYRVEWAPDGAVGKHLVFQNAYDIVLLDLNLPYVSGYELCEAIRQGKPELPIMLVTAMGSIEQKLSGFDAGANDYIVKPYDLRELLARMRNLLKKSTSTSLLSEEEQKELLRVADLEVNTGFRTVRRNDVAIELTAKEFSLLEFLMRRNGRIASKTEIIDHVWGLNFDTGTNLVEVYINFLRKKIDKNFEPKLIHTKQGMGYFIKVL